MQTRVKAAMSLYAETGRGDVVKLQGVEGYRLRVGTMRVLFALNADGVQVYDVGPRGGITSKERRTDAGHQDRG